MIVVNGLESDYAIMKQVQQLRLQNRQMTVVKLDDKTDFSKLAASEKLYLVSHGDISTGCFKEIDKKLLLDWLTDRRLGVPEKFGGIVILSCYSGMRMDDDQKEYSLAEYLATGLVGRAAAGTLVEGANGYSFGTPEFAKSGYSSVLSMDLAAFYYASIDEPNHMVEAWLKHKPAHAGGVLNADLGITVDTGKTIEEHLTTVQGSQGKAPDKIALEYVTPFAKEAKGIEALLDLIIVNKIQGSSVLERARYLMNNPKDADVVNWNNAIDRQYKLFGDLYLWAPPAKAFTAAKVPAIGL